MGRVDWMDLVDDVPASVIDHATRMHERIVEELEDLLARVAGAGEVRRIPVLVTAADRARYTSR
jgi:hypothetical protein